MQDSFPEFDSVISCPPCTLPAYLLHDTHLQAQQRLHWNTLIHSVVRPAMNCIRQMGKNGLVSVGMKDFSEFISWNPFPGPELCFEESKSLAVKCNAIEGYK